MRPCANLCLQTYSLLKARVARDEAVGAPPASVAAKAKVSQSAAALGEIVGCLSHMIDGGCHLRDMLCPWCLKLLTGAGHTFDT